MAEEKTLSPAAADAAPAADEASKGSKFQATLDFLGRNITLTTKEWIYSLLYQPTDPPFRLNADFKDELSRVVRLIVAVLTIGTALVGGLNIFNPNIDMMGVVRDSITVFIVAILLSLIFLPAFYVSGVRIHVTGEDGNVARKHLGIGQVFFTILYTFVPWLPVLVFIRASVTTAENIFLIDFLLLAPFLCFIYMLINFAKSMKVITNSSYLRIWGGISIPVFFLLLYLMV